MGEGVEAAVEARDRERTGEVAHRREHAQRPLVVARKLAGGDDAHGQHFAVAGSCLRVGAMPEGTQDVVKHHVDRYNQIVVHRSLLRRTGVSATPFSAMAPMNDH